MMVKRLLEVPLDAKDAVAFEVEYELIVAQAESPRHVPSRGEVAAAMVHEMCVHMAGSRAEADRKSRMVLSPEEVLVKP